MKGKNNPILTGPGGKLPPQAVELEEAVLGALMIDKEAINTVIDILKPESFYKPAHQEIYQAIFSLFSRSDAIDMLTVTQELRRMGKIDMVGGAVYVMRLTNRVSSAANIETHARQLSELAIKRELIAVSGEILEQAFEDDSDVFNLLDDTEQKLFQISENNIRKNTSPINNLIPKALKEIEARKEFKDGLTGVPSGFTELDRVTAGWQKSDLVIIAARPAMGKCLGAETPVLMYDGTIKEAKHIKVGDLLMGDDSTPRTVLSLATGKERMYWVYQDYAINYRVNESHILSLKKAKEVIDIPVLKYVAKSEEQQKTYKGYKVAVEFPEKTTEQEPYSLGLLVGKDIKTIPHEYIANSTLKRLELLAGIMDSGAIKTLPTEELAYQVKFLADSLGFRTSLAIRKNPKEATMSCEVRLVGKGDNIPLRNPKTVLPTHKTRWKETPISVQAATVDEYYGFVLDGNQRFLLGDCTVTHNTAFALSLLRNAAVHFHQPVAIFSLEMSEMQLTHRLLSSESEIDSEKIKRPNMMEGYEWEQLRQGAERIRSAPIFIDDTPALSVLELRAKCRRLKAQYDIQLIVVDYLQLMSASTGKGSGPGNREQEISIISRSLKSLAKELDVPVLALSQLSRAVETRGGDKKPQLSDLRESGCITGDSLIVDAKTGKLFTIKELAERKEQTNFNCLGVTDQYQVTSQNMIKAFYSGKKQVFELKTRTGRTVKASANHPFLKLEGWTRLDALKVGDKIATPRKINITNPTNPMSEDELILLAHLLGDGCILPSKPYHYTSADMSNVEMVQTTAKRLFNIEGKLIKQENWWHYYLTSPYHLTHNVKHPITLWFEKLGIDRVRSYEKVLPAQLFECDEAHIALFLRHLWATDGNVSWKKIKNRVDSGDVYYGSTSKTLVEQVQHLLLRLGIQSTIRVNKKEGYRNNYHVWVQGAENLLAFLTQVGCHGERGKIIPEMIETIQKIKSNTNLDVISKEIWKLHIEPAKNAKKMSWRTFSDKMEIAYNGSGLFRNSIGRSRLEKIAQVLESETLQNLANSDIHWDEITDITPLDEEDVYDATVLKFHNFTTNDIIVHNSIEQDADMVLFLYRAEYYGITQDLDGNPTAGTGEVLIAKHRNGALKDVKLRFVGRFTKFENLEGDAFNFSPANNGQNKPAGGFISSKVNNASANTDTNNGFSSFTNNTGLTRTDDEPPF
jgi:replicative DNA helicase